MNDLPETNPQTKEPLHILGKVLALCFVSCLTAIFFFSMSIKGFLLSSPIFVLLAWGVWSNKVGPQQKKKENFWHRDERTYGIGGCHSLASKQHRRGH